MNKEQKDFLLGYAKIGVLSEMNKIDEIAAEELKREYLEIKAVLIGTKVDASEVTKKNGTDKIGAVSKWAAGIGKRQKAYEDKHAGDV